MVNPSLAIETPSLAGGGHRNPKKERLSPLTNHIYINILYIIL
jgi:hypothetical protein